MGFTGKEGNPGVDWRAVKVREALCWGGGRGAWTFAWQRSLQKFLPRDPLGWEEKRSAGG